MLYVICYMFVTTVTNSLYLSNWFAWYCLSYVIVMSHNRWIIKNEESQKYWENFVIPKSLPVYLFSFSLCYNQERCHGSVWQCTIATLYIIFSILYILYIIFSCRWSRLVGGGTSTVYTVLWSGALCSAVVVVSCTGDPGWGHQGLNARPNEWMARQISWLQRL